MILREMPDLPPRPLTRSNAGFRAQFYARWGQENAIICGRSRHVEYAPHKQTLSIKLAWGGSETYFVGKRRLTVDDDQYLILNEGRTYSSVLQGQREVDSFCVFFRPNVSASISRSRRRFNSRSSWVRRLSSRWMSSALERDCCCSCGSTGAACQRTTRGARRAV